MADDDKPVSHGTYAGYQQHTQRGIPACLACKAANAAYLRHWRRHGKCAPGLGWPLELDIRQEWKTWKTRSA